MKKLLYLLFLLLPFGATLRAGVTGTWTFYQAYHNAQKTVAAGNTLYALYGGNLLGYDRTSGEVRFFSKNDGLSGTSIQHIAYSREAHTLLIVYSDFGLDLLDDDGTVTTMPQLKNANEGKTSLNDVTVSGDKAILSMSDGVVLLHLKQMEVMGYYRWGVAVKSATLLDNTIYAATENALLTCSLRSNPNDASLWQTVAAVSARYLTAFADRLYYVVASGSVGLWQLQTSADGALPVPQRLTQRVYTGVSISHHRALFYNARHAAVYMDDAPTVEYSLVAVPSAMKQMTIDADGTYWVAEGMSGVVAYAADGSELAATGQVLGGYGPRRDYTYNLHYDGDRLLIAGGRLDPYDAAHYEGTIMVYENDTWRAFREDNIAAVTGVTYRDITRVVQDPADSSHHFASAAGTGLYEYRGGEFVKNYSIHNSPLISAAPGSKRYVRIDGVNYDDAGNLWMVNNSADSLICVLKADGTWSRFYIPAVSKAPTVEKTYFDSKGRLWVCSRRTVSGSISHTAGLLCLDYNHTIDNTADDVATYRTSAYNQDGTSFDMSGGVYDIIEDIDGSLWVGTAGGLVVVSNPDDYASNSFSLTQIKVPRNDGTNYADYLLSGVAVTALDIDGADRKWIGTADNGLYLVSADGTEILHHFTADNSPLLSDNIYDIAVNATTGEVMIGTDVGLCSYQSDATSAAPTLDKNGVSVFPNPVRPEHSGSITVTGLTADADVVVTTTGGQAVARGTSLGGTFLWDGRNASGRKVASGVYYVMATTADGEKGIVAKIVIIR